MTTARHRSSGQQAVLCIALFALIALALHSVGCGSREGSSATGTSSAPVADQAVTTEPGADGRLTIEGPAVHGAPAVPSAQDSTTPEELTQVQTTVTVDPTSVVNPNFQGFGIQWDAYQLMTSDVWRQVVQPEIEYLGPAFVRCMVETWWYVQYTADGNPIFINGVPQYYFNKPPMTWTYQILDYCQQRGIPVVWGDWGDKFGFLTYRDPLWARATAGCLDYLVNTRRYTCIKYYNYGSEPNGSWSPCGAASPFGDFQWYRTGVQNMANEMATFKLDSQVKLSGPTTYGPYWLPGPLDVWLDWAAQGLSSSFDNYDIHWYPAAIDVRADAVESRMKLFRRVIDQHDPQGQSKDFFLFEAGLSTGKTDCDQQTNICKGEYAIWMADLAVQAARAGMAGVCAWDLDDAMHPTGATSTCPPAFKTWGFWNTGDSSYGGMAIRPWYWAWCLMTHTFPQGCQIVDSTCSQPLYGMRAVAAKRTRGGVSEMSLMVVNNSAVARTVTAIIPGVGSTATVQRYDTSKNSPVLSSPPYDLETLQGVNLQHGVTLAVPANTMVCLTASVL